jgi:hypothetical protein
MKKQTCPICESDNITVHTPPSARGLDFWDCATCNDCGYPDVDDPSQDPNEAFDSQFE